MTVLEAMQNRYTTKVYDANKKVSENQLKELAQILQLCPSSINSQPWKFFIIGRQDVKEQLAQCSKHNNQRVIDCSHLIVLTRNNNISLFEEQLAQLPPARLTYFQNNIKPLGEDYIFNWFTQQVYLCLGVVLSTCANMHIDATPMEGIEPQKYDEVLGVTNYATVLAVCIGYRSEDDFNDLAKLPKRRLPIEQVVNTI